MAGANARDIVLAGSGNMREQIDRIIAEHDIAPAVPFPGFLDTSEVAQTMSNSLSLILPSSEEQWGLVVNEAIACGLPIIASEAVGARDLLVRQFENGYVCRSDSAEGLAQAMLEMGSDETRWRAMCERSVELSWGSGTPIALPTRSRRSSRANCHRPVPMSCALSKRST